MDFSASDPKYELALSVGWHFERLHGYVSACVRRDTLQEMQHLDLSHQQLGLLFQLRHAGTQDLSTIAQSLHLSLPATSQLVERLVQRELAERTENPGNRRQKHVTLAPAGQALLARIEQSVAHAYTQLLMHTPQAVLQQLSHDIQRLHAALPSGPCPDEGLLPTAKDAP